MNHEMRGDGCKAMLCKAVIFKVLNTKALEALYKVPIIAYKSSIVKIFATQTHIKTLH